MKRMMAYMLAGVLTLGCGTTAFGEEKTSAVMKVKDAVVEQPLYENKDHAQMVPVREVSSLLGYTVTWDAKTRSVAVSDGTTSLSFAPGTDAYTVGGVTEQIGAAPELKDGVLYAPSRIFSLYFPVALQYDGAGQIVATDLKADGVEQVTGTIVDATMYNLVLRQEDGMLRIFTKENADVNLSDGLLIDSLVTVYYSSANPKAAIKLVQSTNGQPVSSTVTTE
ncbi:copper amine oxidase N-terminal domain-containing protein [Anaerotignum lactatifermentans]|uniref:copper amine oxidase N-terminal domain-containing protein n=1 Tax=Anaerotignum lactatifermentans TaxID=160404 RepID=UPI00308041C8